MNNLYINDMRMLLMRADRDREHGYKRTDGDDKEDTLFALALWIVEHAVMSTPEKLLMLTTIRHHANVSGASRALASHITSLVTRLSAVEDEK